MTFWKTFFCVVVAVSCYFVISLYVSISNSNVSTYVGNWEKVEGVYSTSITVEQDTEFCMCPAYECETMMEATLLAKPTIWGWRNFQYFDDPAYPTPDRPKHLEREWPRPIYAEGGKEYCLSKKQGDSLVVTLKEGANDLWLNIY